ncbi:Ribonuclease H2 subunit A [Babesia sp. Xinjiang]|uniref:Ribonuclease H2 subunit A n=1 Tax=Babesia sp. Xinjiang TaxID=462227 RepID=UPI000A2641DB|nr:Ribonuclease H2 subunit A [Babesia sp. Xinjiang]ORM42093.1 Ribonuclease H2 subunit A [Babesia sp. Xinjiang]
MNNDNLRCFRIFRSGITDRSLPLMLGIDEAGRGPVLGPMVYGGFACPIGSEYRDLLKKEIGVDDSKTLSVVLRQAMFKELNSPDRPFALSAEIITPKYISYKMTRRFVYFVAMLKVLRDDYNLNSISHDSAIALIRHFLSHGFNVKEVYIDAVGSPAHYEAKLKTLFPDLRCVVATKADSKYPVVSAASIVAKVIRDNMIESWYKDTPDSAKVGSGYPGDAVTRDFLASHMDRLFGFSSFVRVSWSTAKIMLEDKKRAIPFEWYDPDSATDESQLVKQVRETQWPPFRTLTNITTL